MLLSQNAEKVSGLQTQIIVEACDEAVCGRDFASAQKILRGKYLLIYANQRLLDEHDFTEPYEESAKMFWIPIKTSAVTDT